MVDAAPGSLAEAAAPNAILHEEMEEEEQLSLRDESIEATGSDGESFDAEMARWQDDLRRHHRGEVDRPVDIPPNLEQRRQRLQAGWLAACPQGRRASPREAQHDA